MNIQTPVVERWGEVTEPVEVLERLVVVQINTIDVAIDYFVNPVSRAIYQRQQSFDTVVWLRYWFDGDPL